jgi:hypothetical protein
MFEKFGNKVKIKSSPETGRRGLAGKTGEIFGHTIPSASGVEVIGDTGEDFAYNVFFRDIRASFWFDEDLLEHLDNAAGTTITLDGAEKKWTKNSDGKWVEEDVSPVSKKKWWKIRKKKDTSI